MKLDTFISKDMFKNLAGCILIVEACTETAKMLLGDFYAHFLGLWLAFIFSILISFIRFLFEGEYTKDGVILAVVNILPIFLGCVGVYQVGIKPIERIISGV